MALILAGIAIFAVIILVASCTEQIIETPELPTDREPLDDCELPGLIGGVR